MAKQMLIFVAAAIFFGSLIGVSAAFLFQSDPPPPAPLVKEDTSQPLVDEEPAAPIPGVGLTDSEIIERLPAPNLHIDVVEGETVQMFSDWSYFDRRQLQETDIPALEKFQLVEGVVSLDPEDGSPKTPLAGVMMESRFVAYRALSDQNGRFTILTDVSEYPEGSGKMFAILTPRAHGYRSGRVKVPVRRVGGKWVAESSVRNMKTMEVLVRIEGVPPNKKMTYRFNVQRSPMIPGVSYQMDLSSSSGQVEFNSPSHFVPSDAIAVALDGVAIKNLKKCETIGDQEVLVLDYYAHPMIHLKGRVVSAEDGQPLSSAFVLGPNSWERTLTDKEGRFDIWIWSREEPITLNMSHDRCDGWTQVVVDVPPGEHEIADTKLKPRGK